MRSEFLFSEAKKYIPGGVNSPVRAFKAVGASPIFIERAEGSKIYDVDGREYIDFVGSWGPMILGHSHPEVIKAIEGALHKGTSYGAPTSSEVEMASRIVEAIPSIEMIRMVNSGTEATMSAIRLARAYTGRDKIIKFEGCYHGHSDSLLVRAGSGAATLGMPDSPGVPSDLAKNTLVLPYNELDVLKRSVEERPEDFACIIVEPVAGNMGVVPPEEGFLAGMRDLCDKHKIVLIFDEVITGFRVSYNGAQGLYGVYPDLTCLGKIIGGGLPVGAFGGKKEIMEQIAPSGPVYQAGTLSGNPLAMTAGLAVLKMLTEDIYEELEEKSEFITKELTYVAKKYNIESSIKRVGSMFTLFFNGNRIKNYSDVVRSDLRRFARYFQGMLERGIYLAPSQFEATFISTAHSFEDLESTIKAAQEVFRSL